VRAFALAGEDFEQFVRHPLVARLCANQLQVFGRVAEALMELSKQFLLLVLGG
jgi:hypothetical protein